MLSRKRRKEGAHWPGTPQAVANTHHVYAQAIGSNLTVRELGSAGEHTKLLVSADYLCLAQDLGVYTCATFAVFNPPVLEQKMQDQ